jgi:hypothetical protein
MTIHANPLAPLMLEAQRIVYDANGACADKRAAIKRLADLLCTPEANHTLLHADSHVDKKVAEARAFFLPSLEGAEHKLGELRPHYDGTQGMSIDFVLVNVRTALKRAREGAR